MEIHDEARPAEQQRDQNGSAGNAAEELSDNKKLGIVGSKSWEASPHLSQAIEITGASDGARTRDLRRDRILGSDISRAQRT
jgi:hypothetical protein